MKAHQFASGLQALADLLKSGPNVEIENLSLITASHHRNEASDKSSNRKADLPIALSALLSLSRIDKVEWLNLISELNLPVEIRPRDASRDILGKVLRVLERDPEARLQLSRKVKGKEAAASPELARALSSLLSE